jgi:hypothetical protein
MAYFARSDAVRAERSRREVMRRVTTTRPKRAHVKTLSFVKSGQITLATFFIPGKVTTDPVEHDHPEHKQVVAIDGWLSVGEVTISWQHNLGYFYEDHVISGGSNPIVFDGREGRPDPFLIERDEVFHGEFLRPEVQEEPAIESYEIGLYVTIETVPI